MIGPEMNGFIGPILEMCAGQFPKTCGYCGKRFETFAEYVQGTRPLGALPDMVDNSDPLCLLSMANCACGSTLALKCEDVWAHAAFLSALGRGISSSGRPSTDILTELRDEIRTLAVSGERTRR